MVSGWFARAKPHYNNFIKALLAGDVDAMNHYMSQVALQSFSYFDTGKNPSAQEPERFYHGFVLGLMVDLSSQYTLTSNRESGFGSWRSLPFLTPPFCIPANGVYRNGAFRFSGPNPKGSNSFNRNETQPFS